MSQICNLKFLIYGIINLIERTAVNKQYQISCNDGKFLKIC